MKFSNVNLRSGFFLDARRIFWRRVSGNKMNFALENFMQPLIVAVVVSFAYLGRGDDVDAYRDSFLYFTSLYAFWVGMFGSCQALNREVQSGEWSYWVLGFRRNPYSHVAAILGVNLSFSVLQSLFFVLALAFILAGDVMLGGEMLRNFIEMFVSDQPGIGSPLFQMGGALLPWLESKCSFLPLVFGVFIFTTTQLLAVLSGTGFGLLFGALFKDSVVSLNVSVGFVVLTGMLSLCGLRANGGCDVDVDNAFLPEFERKTVLSVAADEDDEKKNRSKVSLMVDLGYVLPQRYFFNFSRLFANRDLDKKSRGILVKECCDRYGVTDGNAPPWLRLGLSAIYRRPESVRTRSGVRYWLNREMPDDDDDSATYIRRYLAAHPEAAAPWRVDIWRKIVIRAAMRETLPIFLIFIVCLVTTFFLIKVKKGCYESLR